MPPSKPVRAPRKVKNTARKGADFENKTLKFLVGEGEHTWDIGTIQVLMLRAVGKSMQDTLRERVTIAGSRYAGSKGTGGLDLSIIITKFSDKEKKALRNQWVIGVQCKTSKPSNPEIARDYITMVKEGGVYPMYCWNERGKVIIDKAWWWENFLTNVAKQCII